MDELAEDAAAFGVELPAQARDVCPVLPENWDTVMAFCAAQTQWRHGPSGHPVGLDYAGCRAVVRALGVKWRKVFEGLQVMEGEVLDVIHSRYNNCTSKPVTPTTNRMQPATKMKPSNNSQPHGLFDIHE